MQGDLHLVRAEPTRRSRGLVPAGAPAAQRLPAPAAGVVHRDLKPSNVLIAEDGPRVIDFGISRAVESIALTQAGLVIGSPGFMSPEQAAGYEVGPPATSSAWGRSCLRRHGRGPVRHRDHGGAAVPRGPRHPQPCGRLLTVVPLCYRRIMAVRREALQRVAQTARKEFIIRAGLEAVSQYEEEYGPFTPDEIGRGRRVSRQGRLAIGHPADHLRLRGADRRRTGRAADVANAIVPCCSAASYRQSPPPSWPARPVPGRLRVELEGPPSAERRRCARPLG